MQKIIFILKVILIVSFTCSCSFTKSFEGNIESINRDTVCLPKQCFKLLPNAPATKVGNRAVFRETKNKSIVNCKILKP